MAKRFVIIRKKGSKRVLGAVKIKKGVTSAQVRKALSKSLKKGFRGSIVSESRLKEIIKKQAPVRKRTRKRSKRVRKRSRKTSRKRSSRRKKAVSFSKALKKARRSRKKRYS